MREGGAEEIGRSGYYHGTPLFPLLPPPLIPWGDERPLRSVRGKVKEMFNAKKGGEFYPFLQPSKDDDRERLQSTKSAMTELQKSINWFFDGLGKLMMINEANFVI